MATIVFGFGARRQAREQLAAKKRRRKVKAHEERLEQRALNRQGLRHNMSALVENAIETVIWGPPS